MEYNLLSFTQALSQATSNEFITKEQAQFLFADYIKTTLKMDLKETDAEGKKVKSETVKTETKTNGPK